MQWRNNDNYFNLLDSLWNLYKYAHFRNLTLLQNLIRFTIDKAKLLFAPPLYKSIDECIRGHLCSSQTLLIMQFGKSLVYFRKFIWERPLFDCCMLYFFFSSTLSCVTLCVTWFYFCHSRECLDAILLRFYSWKQFLSSITRWEMSKRIE